MVTALIHINSRQIPPEMACQNADCHNQQRAAYHGGVRTGYLKQHYIQAGSGNGSAGINMLFKTYGVSPAMISRRIPPPIPVITPRKIIRK